MGVVQIRVEVCDVCKDREKAVEHYRLSKGRDRLSTYALCAEDAVELEALLVRLAPSRKPRRAGAPVASMADVNAARTTPAKKRAQRRA
jgi:hypothetical protein